MDWREPAVAVMSHGTAAVLRALAGSDQAFSVRELARLANISPTRARQVVGRLTDHGLVTVDSQRGISLVRLNYDHIATKPSLELATLRARIFDLLRGEVERWQMPALHVSLFGSAARGDGSPTSDVDVLVVHANFDSLSEQDRWDDQLARSADEIFRWTGNWVGWFQVTSDELASMAANDEPIVAEWLRDAITLYGTPLSAMTRNVNERS